MNWNTPTVLEGHARRLELYKIASLNDIYTLTSLSGLDKVVQAYLMDALIGLPHVDSRHLNQLKNKVSLVLSDGFEGMTTVKNIVHALCGFVLGLLKRDADGACVFPLALGRTVIEEYRQEIDRQVDVERKKYHAISSADRSSMVEADSHLDEDFEVDIHLSPAKNLGSLKRKSNMETFSNTMNPTEIPESPLSELKKLMLEVKTISKHSATLFNDALFH